MHHKRDKFPSAKAAIQIGVPGLNVVKPGHTPTPSAITTWYRPPQAKQSFDILKETIKYFFLFLFLYVFEV